jgi:hypothetical protein
LGGIGWGNSSTNPLGSTNWLGAQFAKFGSKAWDTQMPQTLSSNSFIFCTSPAISTLSHLVGGLEHFLFFHSVGNLIIPFDFHIFRG